MPATRYKGKSQSKGELIPLVRMKISSGNYEDNAVVRFDNDAKAALDYDFDAEKVFLTATKPYIYTVSEGTKFAINGLPFPDPTKEIPIVVNVPTTGSHTISATQLQGLDNYPVMLIDYVAGSVTDLKTNPVLSFSAAAGVLTDRFILKVGNISTGKEDPRDVTGMFNIYTSFGNVIIQTLSSEWDGRKGLVRIFDLTGKLIYNAGNELFSTTSLVTIPANLERGIYVVEIKSGYRRYVGKVVVR
jgi:hypothetical protein